METKAGDQFYGSADNIIAYMLSLLAVMVLALICWIAGCLVKRVPMQVSIWLRVDRSLRRS